MSTRRRRPAMRTTIALLLSLPGGCGSGHPMEAADRGDASGIDRILHESWTSYVARFVQKDGRVIDYRNDQVSTSEGQAYAMLRAAWLRDQATFDLVQGWATNNLNLGVRSDHLWAWKWGRAADGSWRALDPAFASDADEDAALALLVAWKTWNDPRYLERARAILADLWDKGTVDVKGRRYLLGGDSLCQRGACRVSPSYLAPYAYRVFARQDPAHDWTALVDTSYTTLQADLDLTATHLPTEWAQLDLASGQLSRGSADDSAYGYVAFRTHWRIAVDLALYDEPRARRFLEQSLAWPIDQWRRANRLPGVVSADGTSLADYESLDMLAGIMGAVQPIAPDVAVAMRGRLQAAYSGGIWQDRDAYYLQNWAWFGSALYARQLAALELVR